jgi:hypothetical protein
MIAIAVAASIIVYVWSIGLLGSLMGGGGSQTRQQLILESYNWQSSSLSFTIRNVGSASVTVASIYLSGNALATNLSNSISIGTALPFTYTPSTAGTFTVGAAYTLKLVSTSGGVFAFSVIDGSAG